MRMRGIRSRSSCAVAKSGSRCWRRTDVAGLGAGRLKHAAYKTFGGRAKPGDSILMFTDGIFEVEGAAGDYFDQQRLIGAVERRLLAPSEELIEGLLTETRDFSVQHQFGDDVCLVVELDHLLVEVPAGAGV